MDKSMVAASAIVLFSLAGIASGQSCGMDLHRREAISSSIMRFDGAVTCGGASTTAVATAAANVVFCDDNSPLSAPPSGWEDGDAGDCYSWHMMFRHVSGNVFSVAGDTYAEAELVGQVGEVYTYAAVWRQAGSEVRIQSFASAATASANLVVNTASTWSYDYSTESEPVGGGFPADLDNGEGRLMNFSGFFVTGTNSYVELGYLIATEYGEEASGNLTLVNGVYEYASNPSGLPAGTYSFDSISSHFYDSDVDLNGDGRFTQEDVDIAGSNISSTNMTVYGGYDYDNDGTLTQDDVDIAQLLIDGGLSAHIFGDVTGDGAADCDDRATYAAHTFGPTVLMGTAGYRVEFDYELDGDNDAADEALLDVIFALRSDMNGDGILDSGDISTFTALFLANDLDADINGDGILDSGDISTFTALFLAGC